MTVLRLTKDMTIDDVIKTFPDVHWSIKRISIVMKMLDSNTDYEIYTVNNVPHIRSIKNETI